MPKKVKTGYSSFAQLISLLAQGWDIEPPVYVRPSWQSRSKKEETYHFILWDGTRVNLVSVHDCPEVQQFLAERKLSTDHI